MGEAAHGGFYASEDDGHIGKELLQNLGIDNGGVFRSHVVAPVGTIRIFGTQTAVGSVLVYHRVHATWSNTEEETGSAKFLEVAEVAMPVWLWHDGHAIACCLQRPSDDSSAKRRMVDVGISREQDDIYFIPSP